MHFLRNKVNSRTGRLFQITRKSLDVLTAHDWPGNVRELENAIERGCALCEDGIIRVADLPPAIHRDASSEGAEELVETPPTDTARAGVLTVAPRVGYAPGGMSQPIGMLRDFLHEQELTYVNRALAQTGGDKEKAAELLGVSVATIYRKLAEEEPPAAPR
jgi:DNA-binding NtrC family response regulator